MTRGCSGQVEWGPRERGRFEDQLLRQEPWVLMRLSNMEVAQ